MAARPSGTPKKRTAGRAALRDGTQRQRPKQAASKPRTPKRSAAMQLAAEVDRLKADLAAARTRLAELETRVDEDPLTGLRNRHGFERALEQALAYVRRYKTPAALLYVDLDRFKPINDRHGHAAGDWVLGRVARLIAGHVRASDVAARIGGDELAVILWNVGVEQAVEKARSLETMIENESFDYKNMKLSIGLSAGVAILAADDTVASALARADAAMYARKRSRKDHS
ncbi:MAG TPA: GGDEF domain-containing protein [Xanthobacteraceae bacterium]|nr:GGDEF domain-containing protein [Xanthobacteraceae bacterium]